MSTADNVSPKENFIEQLLGHGRRLRNSMVQSILNHDPFNIDIFDNTGSKVNFKSKFCRLGNVLSENLSDIGKYKLKCFLKGDFMNRRDEVEALETLKSLSSQDLLKTISQTYVWMPSKCLCQTCSKYAKEDPKCDLKRSHEKYQNEAVNKSCFKTSKCTLVLEAPRNENFNASRTFPDVLGSKPCENLKPPENQHRIPKFNVTQNKQQRVFGRKLFKSEKNKTNLIGREKDIHTPVNVERTLTGFMYIREAEYLKGNIDSFITCAPFFQDICYSKLVTGKSHPIFNFCQLVSLIYEDEFLEQLRDNFMVVEFWEKFQSQTALFGVTKLPLHQFYIAYRNQDATKYVANNKFPIISDCWEAILNPDTNELVGQVQLLLALGTEQQIHNLRKERGFILQTAKANIKIRSTSRIYKKIDKDKIIYSRDTQKVGLPNKVKSKTSISNCLNNSSNVCIPDTKEVSVQSDLQMDPKINAEKKQVTQNEKLEESVKQKITTQSQQIVKETDCNKLAVEEYKNLIDIHDKCFLPNSTRISESESNSFSLSKQYDNAPPLVKSTSDLLNTLQAALSISPVELPLHSKQKLLNHINKSFKAQIKIIQALHLPIRKKCKVKKSRGKTGKGEDNVKPTCYATFETMPGMALNITPLIPKSTSPNWNYKTDVFLPSELLLNNKKRLIIKVWRKSTNTTMVPNLQSDLILGFAAIDVTLLLSGFPNIQGWFNVIDFSSRCNGQINIHITPLEDLTDFKTYKDTCSISPTLSNKENGKLTEDGEIDQLIEEEKELEADGEVLSRALKRKFIELDEITQRLRLRLSHVTNEDFDDGNDDVADEFERDINTLSVEDFDMVSFGDDYQSVKRVGSNLPHYYEDSIYSLSKISDSNDSFPHLNDASNTSTQNGVTKEFKNTEATLSTLDRQIQEGKQRIDMLLGKLSLISGSANSFTPRYTSGCSMTSKSDFDYNIDSEAILKDLDIHSEPNMPARSDFDISIFQDMYKFGDEKATTSVSSNSSTSVQNLEKFQIGTKSQGTFLDDKK